MQAAADRQFYSSYDKLQERTGEEAFAAAAAAAAEAEGAEAGGVSFKGRERRAGKSGKRSMVGVAVEVEMRRLLTDLTLAKHKRR